VAKGVLQHGTSKLRLSLWARELFGLPKLAATKLSPAELPALLDKSSLPRRDCQQRRGFNKIAKCEKTG
jgi:hypothetical protein